MKKAALTFGLFSLVMVATSFAAPEKTSPTYSDNTVDIGIGVDGNQTGGPTKKRDQSLNINNESNLARVNQSLGGNKKLD